MLGVGHVEPSISGVNQFQPQPIPLTGLESLWPWFLGSSASPNLKRIVLGGFYPKDTIWIIIPNKVEHDKMMINDVCTVVNPGPLCFHGFHHINLFNWCLRLGCFRPPLSNAMGMLPPETAGSFVHACAVRRVRASQMRLISHGTGEKYLAAAGCADFGGPLGPVPTLQWWQIPTWCRQLGHLGGSAEGLY
jgi:hypothetical protein